MFLSTGNFEYGLGGWRALNGAAAVAVVVVDDRGQAKQGASFMRFRTAVPQGSVAHDVLVPTAILNERNGILRIANALSFSVWLRSPDAALATGTIAIWDLAAGIASDTEFRATVSWSQFTVGMDRPASNVRVEVYLNEVDQWLDVDGAVLV